MRWSKTKKKNYQLAALHQEEPVELQLVSPLRTRTICGALHPCV